MAEDDAARTRIGKVTFKSAPNVSMLPTAGAENDNRLIRTLIYALRHARKGDLVFAAGVIGVENPDGSTAEMEFGDVSEEWAYIDMLGCMSRLEHNIIDRWKSDSEWRAEGGTDV